MAKDLGRESRFAAWIAEHRGIFFKVARAYADDRTDQAELQQEMAVQLWRSLPYFREQCKPSTWLYRLCLNTALTWKRGQRRRENNLDRAVAPDDLVSTEPRPGWTQEKTELLNALYRAIRELPANERSLVVLSLEGLSYREISEVTGLTETHVGVTLTRARRKLGEILKEVRNEL
jgi:RNA polymerase sigma-70 factor (ECF subfamily)